MRSRTIVLALAALAAAPAIAAFPDDEVHTEGIGGPGEVRWNLHATATPSGRSMPDYPGEIVPAHGWRLVASVSRGLAAGIEAGASIPIAWGPGASARAGAKVNLKWMPLRVDERGRGAYAGVNLEYAWLPPALEPVMRGFEVRPIFGWRGAEWRAAVNPILSFDLSGPGRGARPALSPGLKIARRVAEGIDAGVEYYADLGPVGRFAPRSEQAHVAYLALDVDRPPWTFNFGLGRGVSGSADRWTVKWFVDLPF